MSDRYVLCQADLSGTEDDLVSLAWALRRRDELRARSNPRRVHYRVIDREDPERGDLDWPESGGRARERGRALASGRTSRRFRGSADAS